MSPNGDDVLVMVLTDYDGAQIQCDAWVQNAHSFNSAVEI